MFSATLKTFIFNTCNSSKDVEVGIFVSYSNKTRAWTFPNNKHTEKRVICRGKFFSFFVIHSTLLIIYKRSKAPPPLTLTMTEQIFFAMYTWGLATDGWFIGTWVFVCYVLCIIIIIITMSNDTNMFYKQPIQIATRTSDVKGTLWWTIKWCNIRPLIKRHICNVKSNGKNNCNEV